MKVGLKFCGHCRPFLDMTQLLPLLRTARPDVEFVPSATFGPPDCTPRGADGSAALLRLNACPAACATVPDFTGPQISVTCEAEDQFAPDPDRLVREILAALDRACPPREGK